MTDYDPTNTTSITTQITEVIIDRTEFKEDADILSKLIQLSVEKAQYTTVHVGPKKVRYYFHDRKPTINSAASEETFRYYGGFYKSGRCVPPSPSFVRKFNRCPVSR